MEKYLLDKSFLKYIDLQKVKEQYVKITILDWDENPLEDITGIVTGGSINIDGSSSVRRTANLSVFVQNTEANITQPIFLLTLNKKVKIEIGFKNTFCSSNNYQKYQNLDFIWFPMGIYVIIQNSISHGTGGTNISLQLKDKMCLLNGECGGTLPASVVFNEIETYDEDGNIIITHPTIYQIIQEAVHHWGKEQIGKILIADLSSKIKKVMKWNGNTPLYWYQQFIKEGSSYKRNSWLFTTNEDAIKYDDTGQKIQKVTQIYDEKDFELSEYDTEDSICKYILYESGQDVGYIYTDFSYPNGDLIGNAGDSVCSILDQLRDTLGNFEYFYDLDGNFRFQEIKNYLNTSQSTVEIKELNSNPQNYLIDQSNGKSVYSFNDNTLVTSYSNSPQINMIKNDFLVWGERESATGQKIPIRYHLAIDDKPNLNEQYTYYVIPYRDPYDNIIKAKTCIPIKSIKDAPIPGSIGKFYIIPGAQNGEVYSETSIGGTTGLYPVWTWTQQDFWKKVFLTQSYDIYTWDAKDKRYIKIPNDGQLKTLSTPTSITDWRTLLYLQGVEAEALGVESNEYFVELVNEWPKIYDIWGTELHEKTDSSGQNYYDYQPDFYNSFTTTPSDGDFYLDFIDTASPLGEFKISNIGRRTKVVVDSKVNCLFAPKIPDLVLIENIHSEETEEARQECKLQNQNYIQVSTSIYDLLTGGGGFNSAYDAVRDLLYQYTSYNESISLQTLPIYYLDVNTRISVTDLDSNINGDYIINSISIPLDISSTMSISATKAISRI